MYAVIRKTNYESLCAKSWCVETACRRRINALMISMFTWTARSLVRTEDSMTIPCSVKTYGAYFRCFPRPVFKAPDWLLKEADSSTASWIHRRCTLSSNDPALPKSQLCKAPTAILGMSSFYFR